MLKIMLSFCLILPLGKEFAITIYHSYSNSNRSGAKCVKHSKAFYFNDFGLKKFNIVFVKKMFKLCKIFVFHIRCEKLICGKVKFCGKN